jgi:ArsR family transcriptional regulator, arsenate/arsenite/antimonite-responsive transcriptional repressor
MLTARRIDPRSFVRVLKALAHDTRLEMVRVIAAAGEMSCGQVAARFTLSQPTISHHLKQLRDAGVLSVRQEAQTHYIRVDEALVDTVSTWLRREVSVAKPKSRSKAKRSR